MPRRHILTARQRSALLDLPTDEASLLRHYILADDDLIHIDRRRRPENRIGFALQLCALRYPGRALAPGELIPQAISAFLGAKSVSRVRRSYATLSVVRPGSSTWKRCAVFTAIACFRDKVVILEPFGSGSSRKRNRLTRMKIWPAASLHAVATR